MSLRAAWESIRERSNIDWPAFETFCLGAVVHDVTVDGKDAGAVVVIGPEIHACVLPFAFGRWFGKRAAAILAGVIAQHGYTTTTVAAGNEIGDAFVRRLGFSLVHADDSVRTYRKE